MAERPILFSGPMVRAILAGTKTQTRRVWKEARLAPRDLAIGDRSIACPYGEAGDRLWVRETHAIESNRDVTDATSYPPPFADGRPILWRDDPDYGRVWSQCHYRATDPDPELVSLDDPDDASARWRPSIFMPRWASRITLDVLSVRVERVQDISEADAQAEGAPIGEYFKDDLDGGRLVKVDHRLGFRVLWDGINDARGYGWAVNPWVWVVEFKVVQL